MSKPVAHAAPPIATGILVSVTGIPSKVARPSPKRKTVRRELARQVPWLWIVTGSCAMWAIMLLAFVMNSAASGFQEPDEAALVALRLDMQPIAAPAPVIEQPSKVAETPVDLAPVVIDRPPTPLPLRPVAVPPVEEMPPPIEIKPEPVVPVVAEPPAPQPVVNVPAPPKAPMIREDLDLTRYANCQQIGTNILFMKDPPEAFKRARAEKKLVFIVHLSGNLEDKEFT